MLAPVAVLAVALGATVAVLVLPRVTQRRLLDARPPTEDERDRLDRLGERAALSVRPAYVIETGDGPSLDVAVRGPPGWRALFVTDDVLADLDADVAAALLAAEAGRVRTYYGPFRAGAIGVVLATLVATFAVPLPFDTALAAMGAFALVAFAVGRRLQYAADARAAERVGAGPLADAFERIAGVRGVEPPRGSWRTLFEIQPPLGDRIDRLRDRARAGAP